MEFWISTTRRAEFVFTVSLLLVVMLSMLRYLHYNETRIGVQVADPLLTVLPAIDLSELIFFLLYAGLFSTVFLLLPQPHRLLIGLQVYIFYAALRTLSMWLLPLEAPAGLIPLTDPLMSWASTGVQLNKDLFFSGHTSTMFIFYLLLPPGRIKSVYLIGFIVMILSLIIQRVHYSVDVLAAPFFSYGALGIVLHLRKKLNLDADLHDG
ncbi:MAG TPA: phosphatase PAP2-related protein [Turneriella sp.]|nr:phosphatase PAP2-related protein [Turneriella sp.]